MTLFLVRTGRILVWDDVVKFLMNGPGINVRAAQWLVEGHGAMIVGADQRPARRIEPLGDTRFAGKLYAREAEDRAPPVAVVCRKFCESPGEARSWYADDSNVT